MSNIPKARYILGQALCEPDRNAADRLMVEALALMDRRRPQFVAERRRKMLSPADVEWAKALRSGGKSLQDIAEIIGTNTARVSEATNPHPEGKNSWTL